MSAHINWFFNEGVIKQFVCVVDDENKTIDMKSEQPFD